MLWIKLEYQHMYVRRTNIQKDAERTKIDKPLTCSGFSEKMSSPAEWMILSSKMARMTHAYQTCLHYCVNSDFLFIVLHPKIFDKQGKDNKNDYKW